MTSADIISRSPSIPRRRALFVWQLLIVVIWLAVLAGILAAPYVMQSPSLGDDLTRNTVRLALVGYAIALNLLLVTYLSVPDEFISCLTRLFWTLGWLTYLVHLAMAFHFYHGWSHQSAIEHTRAVSGVGEGIYVSHLFTLLWSADVVSWWLRPQWHKGRPAWIDGSLHGFMLFIVFNATVVYETGPIRWAGLLLIGELLTVGFYACRRRRCLR